jgi:predicted alpha/beta-hydrolase family hydrolase
VDEQFVDTPVGPARLDWFHAVAAPSTTLVLGHGTATGVEARDLQTLARALPPLGCTVVLMTQPYRIDGNFEVAGERSLDQAWKAIWREVVGRSALLIAGGRSAGSQVACRTARALGADAVLALAYPLLGPGSAAELLATGKPTLIVQGGRDPFGRPSEFPTLPAEFELVEIPDANHMFAVDGPNSDAEPLEQVTSAVIDWLDRRRR